MKNVFSFIKSNFIFALMVLVGLLVMIDQAYAITGIALPFIFAGMAEIKSMAAIKEKWTRVTPQRADDYLTGVKSPKRDWAAETGAAAANWKAGVDNAASKGLFAKGVNEAGTKKWQEKASSKGPGRFAEGVYGAGNDYEKGFAPYRAAIAAVDLGPKFPRRDPRNLDRVKKVVTALVEAKQGK